MSATSIVRITQSMAGTWSRFDSSQVRGPWGDIMSNSVRFGTSVGRALLLSSSALILLSSGDGVRAQEPGTPLPEIKVTTPSPIQRPRPAQPSRPTTATPTTTAAPAPPPPPQPGTLPVVADQF